MKRVTLFILLCGTLLTSVCFAEDEISSVAEFCATFTDNKNEYQLHLIKNISIPPNPRWIYPDTVRCGHCRCRAYWESSFEIEAPYDIFCNLSGLLGGGGGGVSTCCGCPCRKESAVTPITRIRLDPTDSDGLVYTFVNARENLKRYYGKKFRGSWETRLHETSIRFDQEFDALLVGECDKPFLIAEYCVSQKDSLHLYKTRELGFFPKTLFPLKDEIVCVGGYKVQKTLELHFSGYGNKTMGPYTESEVCGRNDTIETSAEFPIPEYIGLNRVATKSQKQEILYGKDFPAKWTAKLECNSKSLKREINFFIRVRDACTKEEEEWLVDPDLDMRFFQLYKNSDDSENSCIVHGKD